jgi:chemotaxis protein histidine kinase CheA
MRGSVKVESTLGKGSKFIVTLPMVKATSQQTTKDSLTR